MTILINLLKIAHRKSENRLFQELFFQRRYVIPLYLNIILITIKHKNICMLKHFSTITVFIFNIYTYFVRRSILWS